MIKNMIKFHLFKKRQQNKYKNLNDPKRLKNQKKFGMN